MATRVRNRFICNGPELEAITRFSPSSVRTQHSTGRGALVPVLTKFGDRLGVWSSDWDAFVNSQRKLRSDERAHA
jgi:hypothetical protein